MAKIMSPLNKPAAELVVGEVIATTCPTCGAHTQFTFIGVQRWPERVAAQLDIPADSALWQCGHCLTTLHGVSLPR